MDVGASSISKRCGFARSINLIGWYKCGCLEIFRTFDYQMSHRVGEAEISKYCVKIRNGSSWWWVDMLGRKWTIESGTKKSCLSRPLVMVSEDSLFDRHKFTIREIGPEPLSVPLIKDDGKKLLK